MKTQLAHDLDTLYKKPIDNYYYQSVGKVDVHGVHPKPQSSLKTEEVEWLTSPQAARYLQISEGVLRNMTSSGSIPYYKLGRSNRYKLDELRKLLLSKKRGCKNGN